MGLETDRAVAMRHDLGVADVFSRTADCEVVQEHDPVLDDRDCRGYFVGPVLIELVIRGTVDVKVSLRELPRQERPAYRIS